MHLVLFPNHHSHNQSRTEFSKVGEIFTDWDVPLREQSSWIQNPFASHKEDVTAGLSSREQDRLVDLSCDAALKLIFSQTHLTHFWMHVNSELYS